jgi:hypothetical protein
MLVILLVQPDSSQADMLRDAVAARINARVDVVATKDDAICAITSDVPDLILISALLGPRDEEAIVAFLRALDDAVRPQTVLVPRFEQAAEPQPRPSRFALRRRPEPTRQGCDPAVFVDEVRTYLEARAQVRQYEAALDAADAFAPEVPMSLPPAAPPPFDPPPFDPSPAMTSMPPVLVEAQTSVVVKPGHSGAETPIETVSAVDMPPAPTAVEQRNISVLANLQAEADARRTLLIEEARVEEGGVETARAESGLAVDVDARLRDAIESIRLEVETARLAEQSEAARREEQIREAAAAEARAAVAQARTVAEEALMAAEEAREAAERVASSTLTIEIARLRTEWEARLLAEVSRVREEAGQQHASAFVALRTQISELRKARELPQSSIAMIPAAARPQPDRRIDGELRWSVPSRLAVRRRDAIPAATIERSQIAPPPPSPRSERSRVPPWPLSAANADRSKALSIAATLVFLTSGGVAVNLASFNLPSLKLPAWVSGANATTAATVAVVEPTPVKPPKRRRKAPSRPPVAVPSASTAAETVASPPVAETDHPAVAELSPSVEPPTAEPATTDLPDPAPLQP